jgi:hypothetical protein
VDLQAKTKQFFEQLPKGRNPTAVDIGEAARATGYTPDLILVIRAFSEYMGINPESEIADFAAAVKKAEVETAAALAREKTITAAGEMEKLAGALKAETNPAKIHELKKALDIARAEVETAGKRSPFIEFSDYIRDRTEKEYWREFAPRLFDKLPFPDGTISAIGARTGSGKTAAMINLCRELLMTKPADNPQGRETEKAQDINAKRKILFISAEMTAEDITDRLIHSLAWHKGKNDSAAALGEVPHTNADYWKALKYAYHKAPQNWLYDSPEITRAKLYKDIIEEYIRPVWGDRLKIAYVRGLNTFNDIYNLIIQNAEPGTLVLIDYLQLLPIIAADIGQGNPRYLEIRHIMDMAILAAEKTKSVIITAAQLGREESKGENSGDDTLGWRESGDIEQTAWNLIKIARKENEMFYRVSKARNSAGLNTVYDLQWIPGYQYMENMGEKKAALLPEKKSGNKEKPDGNRTPDFPGASDKNKEDWK